MTRALRISVSIMVAALAACGDKGGHGGGTDGGVDASGAPVKTLAITPATATVALTQAGLAFTGTQPYTVTATYDDGSTADVTSAASYISDDFTAVHVASGTATVTAAGRYTITASIGGASANATLTATLDGSGTGPGVDPGAGGKLGGNPDPGQVPTIAYPLAGSLFPINVAPIEVHVQKSDPAQTIARVSFTAGSTLHFDYVASCAASPNPGSFANACIVTIAGDFARQLAGVSEADDVSLRVRLAAADGSKLGESAPIALAWARTPLTGGLYYWTTAGKGDTKFNTAVARYDFSGDASKPEIYLSSDEAPAVPAGQTQCIGCHSVSHDGTRLGFSLGGSGPAYFAQYDVATKKVTASSFTDKFGSMSTYAPDAGRVVTGAYGKLTLRKTDATLGVVTDDLFGAAVNEYKSHPFWSPTGRKLAFVSWVPTAADIQAGRNTGDMVQGGEIWLTDSDGTTFTGAPHMLVPRADKVTSYYPAISDDDRFVVFNQSSCTGPSSGGWGPGPCDGYNDISARLMLVSTTTGAPIALAHANGGDAPLTTNSWPRWSPDHGTFRGRRLYWVAFSSRRPYGLALPGSTSDTTKPQLWFAAVAVDDKATTTPAADPSFAPIWMPGQDPDLSGPRGNHTPAWTSTFVE
jgi:hypothetical protein